LKPIKELLNEFGGWPVIMNKWNDSVWRWQDVVMKLEDEGFQSNFLFEISFEPDYKNSTKRVISVRIF
jgi:hypothetical protein